MATESREVFQKARLKEKEEEVRTMVGEKRGNVSKER